MEASFRDRVDKTFGSLGVRTAGESGGASSALWCLTDEEIERRRWNRHVEESEDRGGPDSESGPSFGDVRLDGILRDLSDGEEDEETVGENSSERRRSNGSVVDEYLDVQSNIGRDCTLDYEDEEDEYDKVAVGMEQRGDRLYMRHLKVAESGTDEEVNGYGELPNTFGAASRDPRANHAAALVRLKEDAEAAEYFDSSQKFTSSAAMSTETEDLKREEADADHLKSILKRRENTMDSRSQKRVRFVLNPERKTQPHEDDPSSEPSVIAAEVPAKDDTTTDSELATDVSRVPDYLRNPSRYTRYTFDSSDDMDDQSNQRAFMEFFQSMRKRNTDPSDDGIAFELPKSIVFTPKRRQLDDVIAKGHQTGDNTGGSLKNRSLCVLGEDDSQETEVSAMEEDEDQRCIPGAASSSSGKPGRQYRTRYENAAGDNS